MFQLSNRKNNNIGNNTVILKSFILFLFLTLCDNCISQNMGNTPRIIELNSFLSSLKSTSVSEFEKLDGLIHNVNPAIYTYDNILKIYGENCTVLFTDMPSINYAKDNPIPSNNIELLQINIRNSSDLNKKIDLSAFDNFPNLKYIYIYSVIVTNENYLNQIFKNFDSKYTIVYKINPGE